MYLYQRQFRLSIRYLQYTVIFLAKLWIQQRETFQVVIDLLTVHWYF